MAPAADWSSLPGELVHLVAGRLLATNDLDSYVDLRAVCHGWRSSTADPRESPLDPRFQPRHWAMLDDGAPHLKQTHASLFVNVRTGRFVRKDLPLLRKYFFVAGAAGGWLVLAERSPPHAARLLNPFTGSLVQFRAPVPPELKLEVAAHVIGSSLTLLLRNYHGTPTIYWAARPSSESFVVSEKEKRCDHRLSRQALIGGGSHALEPVKDIRNRAIFVGKRRSLAVDADKFACVEANCVYYVRAGSSSYRVLSLEGAREVRGVVSLKGSPFSAVQLLCRYTSHIERSQLGLMLQDPFVFAMVMEVDWLKQLDGLQDRLATC